MEQYPKGKNFVKEKTRQDYGDRERERNREDNPSSLYRGPFFVFYDRYVCIALSDSDLVMTVLRDGYTNST